MSEPNSEPGPVCIYTPTGPPTDFERALRDVRSFVYKSLPEALKGGNKKQAHLLVQIGQVLLYAEGQYAKEKAEAGDPGARTGLPSEDNHT